MSPGVRFSPEVDVGGERVFRGTEERLGTPSRLEGVLGSPGFFGVCVCGTAEGRLLGSGPGDTEGWRERKVGRGGRLLKLVVRVRAASWRDAGTSTN